eukprot:m.479461 g.479461  ORF g.479461 m.479461 type:complete len:384 (-) comp57173_c0_seq39:4383-5534(-)
MDADRLRALGAQFTKLATLGGAHVQRHRDDATPVLSKYAKNIKPEKEPSGRAKKGPRTEKPSSAPVEGAESDSEERDNAPEVEGAKQPEAVERRAASQHVPDESTSTTEPAEPHFLEHLSKEELLERLKQKMSEIQESRKRKPHYGDDENGKNGKRSNRDRESTHERRQQAKKQRQQSEAITISRQQNIIDKFGQARPEQDDQEKEKPAARSATGPRNPVAARSRPIKEQLSNIKKQTTSQGIVFSKFDFSDAKREPTSIPKAKKLQLIAKADEEAKKLKELQQENPEHAKLVVQQKGWENALLRAEGVKVKDATVLKKQLKRKEKQKEKSSKDWKKRLSHVSKQKQQRISKRDANIQSRIDKAKSKNFKRPGFEGGAKKAKK